MIGMVLSFSVLVLMVMNQPVSTPVQPQEPENQQTKLQEPIQQEPVQEEISYPMDSGTVTFTIYSETIDPNTLDNQILATKTMPIEKFKDGYVYQMPSSPKANGYIFMDWVIFKNNKQPQIIVENGLDAQELKAVEPDKDGNRKINIYAAWRTKGTGDWPLELVLDAQGGTIDNKPSITYDACTPLYSGGMVYLNAYPIPTKEGYLFKGWYDENDQPVYALTAINFCQETNQGVNWAVRHPITLYAKWE